MRTNKITNILKAIADPTRREIFHVLVLASTALSIHQIAEQFDISRQGITKHLVSLQQAGLVQIESKGREKVCLANPKPLKEVSDWLAHYEKFWDEKLDGLGAYLSSK